MRIIFACLLALLLAAPPVLADDPAYGLRLGYTSDGDLDQMHAGGHVAVVRITPNIEVVPSLEIGFGDGTLLALNGDVIYELSELAGRRWRYYAGGGPLLSRYSHGRHRSTDFALSLVVGAARELRPTRTLFGELRLGLEDAPALKLTAGLTFH